MTEQKQALFTIFGATGDLAKKESSTLHSFAFSKKVS